MFSKLSMGIEELTKAIFGSVNSCSLSFASLGNAGIGW